MKLFYSRVHALRFLKVHSQTLERAVDRGWIRVIRLGPRAGHKHKEQFFLRSDLVDFREKYRSGYFEPSAILRRTQRGRRLRVNGQTEDPVGSQFKPSLMFEVVTEAVDDWREYLKENGLPD